MNLAVAIFAVFLVVIVLAIVVGLLWSKNDNSTGKIGDMTASVKTIIETIDQIQKNVTTSDGKLSDVLKDVPALQKSIKGLLSGVAGVDGRVTELAKTVQGLPEAVKELQDLTATLSTQASVDQVKKNLSALSTGLHDFFFRIKALEDRDINLELKLDQMRKDNDKALEDRDINLKLKLDQMMNDNDKALSIIQTDLKANTQQDAIYNEYVNKINRYVNNVSVMKEISNDVKLNIFKLTDYVEELSKFKSDDFMKMSQNMTTYLIKQLSRRYPCLEGNDVSKGEVFGKIISTIINSNKKSGMTEFNDDDLEILWSYLYVSNPNNNNPIDKSPINLNDFPSDFKIYFKYNNLIKDTDKTIDYNVVKSEFKKGMNSFVYDCKNWNIKLNEIFKDAIIDTCTDLNNMMNITFDSCKVKA